MHLRMKYWYINFAAVSWSHLVWFRVFGKRIEADYVSTLSFQYFMEYLHNERFMKHLKTIDVLYWKVLNCFCFQNLSESAHDVYKW